jgi:DNA-binding transcriptional LysR family regulator
VDVGIAVSDRRAGATPFAEAVIWEDEVVIGVPAGHPWSSESEIDPAEFARTPTIQRDAEASCSQLVRASLAAIGLIQTRPLAEIGCSGVAVATALALSVPVVLSAAAIAASTDDGLEIRRVRGMAFTREFVLVLAGAPEELSAPVREFARQILEWRARDSRAVFAAAS